MLEANLEKYEEQLIMKGRLEGRLKGRLKGRLDAARMLFDAGHSVEPVKKLTGLSDEELEKLKSWHLGKEPAHGSLHGLQEG